MSVADELCRFLRFGRFVAVLPFKAERSGDHFICTNKQSPFKVITSMVQIFYDILVIVRFVLEVLKYTKKENILTGFLGSLVYSCWMTHYFIFRYVTSQKKAFTELLNAIRSTEIEMSSELGVVVPKPKMLQVSVGIFVVMSAMNVSTIFSEEKQAAQGGHGFGSSAELFRWFIKSMFSDTDSAAYFIIKNVGDVVLFIMYCYAYIHQAYTFQFCFVHAYTLLIMAKSFLKCLSSRTQCFMTEGKKTKIIEICWRLVTLCETMERAIGLYVFCFSILMLLFYSFIIIHVFTQGWIRKFQVTLCCFCYILTLLVAAEANSTLKKFARYHAAIPMKAEFSPHGRSFAGNADNYMDNFELLLMRIAGNSYGIKGIAFTITYGFVGNLSSMILTYTLIIIQSG